MDESWFYCSKVLLGILRWLFTFVLISQLEIDAAKFFSHTQHSRLLFCMIKKGQSEQDAKGRQCLIRIRGRVDSFSGCQKSHDPVLLKPAKESHDLVWKQGQKSVTSSQF